MKNLIGSVQEAGTALLKRNRTPLLLSFVLLLLVAFACSKNNNSNNNGNPPSTNKITIANMAFTPAAVTIAVGATVTWTNNDNMTHTVTSDNGSFDSGNIAVGTSYSKTFATAGTFPYHCSIHPEMTGSVVVK